MHPGHYQPGHGVASSVEELGLLDWLPSWVLLEITQAMTPLEAGFAPVVESLLQTLPALAGGLTLVIWVIWGLGSALLLVLGAGLHLGIARWRRHSGGAGLQPGSRLAA